MSKAITEAYQGAKQTHFLFLQIIKFPNLLRLIGVLNIRFKEGKKWAVTNLFFPSFYC